MAEYNEAPKNEARDQVLCSAIEALTNDRSSSTLTKCGYVRQVRDHLIKAGTTADQFFAQKLSIGTVDRWEGFYNSIVQSKSPASLKVAYLAGPNPENDLRVICHHGVLPENIWAFESDYGTYLSAVSSALASDFPFIKLVHSGIEAFIEASPQRFDIIYLDFCGPIPCRNKKQRTLSVITKILNKHALNSPGVLITNTSLPNEEQDAEGRSLISKLVASYLYPKGFLEAKQDTDSDFVDGPISEGIEFDDWLTIVTEDLDNYYGQFVTRLIMDHVSLIAPYDGFPTSSVLFKRLFKIGDPDRFSQALDEFFHFTEDGDGGDVICEPEQSPILWTLAALNKKLNDGDCNYPNLIGSDKAFNEFCELFLRELSFEKKQQSLVNRICQLSFLLQEKQDGGKYLSKSLRELSENHDFNKYFLFCDLVLFHQILELVFRQLAVPYHMNIEKTKRWTYQSKATQMFMDMTILDECRYVYDWMPTADMIASGFNNEERQLAYRFALDGVSKHRRWYNPEYFYGTAVIDQFKKGFEAKVLSARFKIT